MLWPGMRFSLRSQCKSCSAGRSHSSLPRKSFEPFMLNETKPTYGRSSATCTSWLRTLRTHILHHGVPRISTIFILLRLNALGQRKRLNALGQRKECFGRVCPSPCALNVSAALQDAYTVDRRLCAVTD